MNWKQKALYNAMSEISETCYCAGWMNGNEFTLWEMVSDPKASRRYGMDEVATEDLAELKAISDEIGGWIYYHDDENEPTLPPIDWGPRFIAMEPWLEMYQAQNKAMDALRARIEAAKSPTTPERHP